MLEDVLCILMVLLGVAATFYIIFTAILLELEDDTDAGENKENYI